MTPNETRAPAIGQRSRSIGITAPIASAAPTAPATASAWPAPSGTSARSTAPRRRSCMPSATANSQPIPGLMPWKAPSASSITHDVVVISVITHLSRETVRIGAGVAPLEMDLVRTHPVERHESCAIQLEAAVGTHISLREPAFDPVWIELLVPRAIQRVGHVDPLAVTADLDHLRRAVERLIGPRRMRRAPGDSSEPDRAGLDRIERIGDVELLQLAGAEARDIEESIVERQIDVRDEGRYRAEPFQQRRQAIGRSGFSGNLDHFVDTPATALVRALAVPHPDGSREVLQAGDHADEPVGLVGIVSRAQLQRHLLFRAKV